MLTAKIQLKLWLMYGLENMIRTDGDSVIVVVVVVIIIIVVGGILAWIRRKTQTSESTLQELLLNHLYNGFPLYTKGIEK